MNLAIRFIVGLGNAASSYDRTRHNAGRKFIDHYTRSWGKPRNRKKVTFATSPTHSVAASSSGFSGPVMAGTLDCYMNESGPALQSFLSSEKISPSNLLVVVDDFMIPLGSVRLRAKGSSGGHNGLKSIIEALGGDEFGRLRIGIGPVPSGEDPADFVLEKFAKLEIALLDKIFPEIESGLHVLLESGYEKAMNVLNKKISEPLQP